MCVCDFERENEKFEIIVYLCDTIWCFTIFLLFHLEKKFKVFVFVCDFEKENEKLEIIVYLCDIIWCFIVF